MPRKYTILPEERHNHDSDHLEREIEKVHQAWQALDRSEGAHDVGENEKEEAQGKSESVHSMESNPTNSESVLSLKRKSITMLVSEGKEFSILDSEGSVSVKKNVPPLIGSETLDVTAIADSSDLSSSLSPFLSPSLSSNSSSSSTLVAAATLPSSSVANSTTNSTADGIANSTANSTATTSQMTHTEMPLSVENLFFHPIWIDGADLCNIRIKCKFYKVKHHSNVTSHSTIISCKCLANISIKHQIFVDYNRVQYLFYSNLILIIYYHKCYVKKNTSI